MSAIIANIQALGKSTGRQEVQYAQEIARIEGFYRK